MPSSPEHAPSSWALADEVDAVRDEAARTGTRIARVLLKTPQVRVVVVGMAEGVTWPEHKATGRVLIHVERGRIDLRTGDHSSRFGPGMLVALEPAEPHDVHAVEDAAFLLIIGG